MPHILLVFESATTIEFNVAGVPAAARAIHAMSRPGEISGCTLVADQGWVPSGNLLSECERLASGFSVSFGAVPGDGEVIAVRGEAFVDALARAHGSMQRADILLALSGARASARPSPVSDLRDAARRILAATGKSGDGIVSRHLNRPISRAISGQLLKVRGLTPFHATIGTALIGLAMVLSLVFGGGAGLIAGAVLFQAASIFDGVDGEMARATFRTSKEGAALDSFIDACTNLAFVLGVTINVLMAGDAVGAAAGAFSLTTLAAGLTMIGRRSKTRNEPLNFDMVKGHFRDPHRRSLVREGLVYLTMRDFYAAAFALLIIVGLTHFVLLAFATVALGWFCVTAVLLNRHARRPAGIRVEKPAPAKVSEQSTTEPARKAFGSA